jgi:hypothetical protein
LADVVYHRWKIHPTLLRDEGAGHGACSIPLGFHEAHPCPVAPLATWDVIFFDTDRMRTALPRRARFNSDEVMIEFARRAGGLRTSEDRNIFDMMIQRKSGEITLELTDEQYAKLRK